MAYTQDPRQLLEIPDVKAFIQETINRFRKRSPKYFKIWQKVNAIIAMLGILPQLIEWVALLIPGFIVPENWMVAVGHVVSVVGFYGLLMNTFGVSVPENLPFTEKKNIEKALNKTK